MTLEPDTIAALATPPGRGAIALVRVSGPGACEVVRAVAPSWTGASEPRRSLLTRIVDPADGRWVDHALVTYYRAPRSFTGEDLVEISTHGGALVPTLTLAALERAGARAARPGEFTQRAYLNGKLDLIQAEAVRDLVEARSEALHRAALHQVEGGLSRRISRIREDLVSLEAHLVHHIDFPEEDDPPVPVERIADLGRDVAASLRALLETAPEGELLHDGAVVVLAGRPNAGKSSLFNALLGKERAIVTAQAGTTRDALEADVSLEGLPFRLVDTAGIRDTDEEVERRGVEVARRHLSRAEVVVLCVSAEWGWGVEEDGFVDSLGEETHIVLAVTKVDRFAVTGVHEYGTGGKVDRFDGRVPVSAVEGSGLRELRSMLAELVFTGLVVGGIEGDGLLTHRRQADGVRTALSEVEAFARALEAGVPAEVAASHLRPAESALEDLLGIITPDEVLDRVFAEFCIGK